MLNLIYNSIITHLITLCMYKLEDVPSKHQLFDIELVQFIGCLNLFSGAGLHSVHIGGMVIWNEMKGCQLSRIWRDSHAFDLLLTHSRN